MGNKLIFEYRMETKDTNKLMDNIHIKNFSKKSNQKEKADKKDSKTIGEVINNQSQQNKKMMLLIGVKFDGSGILISRENII